MQGVAQGRGCQTAIIPQVPKHDFPFWADSQFLHVPWLGFWPACFHSYFPVMTS